MQFVDVCIEYPSGVTIIDRGSYDADLGMVYVSARARAVLDLRDRAADHDLLAQLSDAPELDR